MELYLICLYLGRRILSHFLLFFFIGWKELIYKAFVLPIPLKSLFIVGGDDFVLRNSQLRLCKHGLIFCEVAKLLFNSNFLLGVGSRFYSDIGFPNFLDLFFSLDLCSSVAFVDFTILH